MYEQWWYMALCEVEDVSWLGKVMYFVFSFGIFGVLSKYILVIVDMWWFMKYVGLWMFFVLINFDVDFDFFIKFMLMLGGSSDLDNQGGYFWGDFSGINVSQLLFWLCFYYKLGGKILCIKSWDEKIVEIFCYVLEWDIGFLVGIFFWLQFMMECIIEDYQFNIIYDIWLNLEVCVYGGIVFELLKKGFECLFDCLFIYMDFYLASEGFIVYQQWLEINVMCLLLYNGIFFEFIFFNSSNFDEDGKLIGNLQILIIVEVEFGVDYVFFFIICVGVWCYFIGDMVCFLEVGKFEIIISGWIKYFFSICGEYFLVDNMNQGI